MIIGAIFNFLIFIVIVIVGVLLKSLPDILIRISQSDTMKCSVCKAKMTSNVSRLFLTTARLDDTHPDTVEYYRNNCRPIKDISEVPSGYRACYFHLFQCPECGNKRISVVDILPVRGVENVMGGNVFDYADLQSLMYP